MSRPRFEIETTHITKTLRFLVYSLHIVSILILVLYYNQLPEKVPIYFNWPTKENGLGSKSILWSAPIFLGLGSLLLLRLANLPWILNYPTRITEENAKAQYSMASLMLRLLSLLIAFTCLALILGSVTSTNNGLNEIIKTIYRVLPFLFFGLPLFFVFKLAFNRNE
jgi:hypothetical protein